MWYKYILEYYAVMKNEVMPFICSNMDETRYYHTKWSKSNRERQISYDIPYMWNIFLKGTNELISKIETHRHRKQTYSYQRGKGDGGEDKLWDGLIHMHYYI